MIASATLFTDATLFSGAWAVLPAGGIALVLANQMLNAPSRLKSLLSSRFLVRAGDISYSWYLWHWPLLVMAPVLFPDHPLQVTVAAVALSLVLAELSYRFVEKPFRHHVALRLPTGGVVAAALTGTVATAGALTLTKRDSAGEQLSERQRLLLAAREDRPTLYALGCHVGLTEMHVGECTVGLRDSLHVVVLFGDSHAAHWYPARDRLAIDLGWKLVSITKPACPSVEAAVLLESHWCPYHECTAWGAAALRRIAELKPALVVLGNSSRYAPVSGAEWEAAARRTMGAISTLGAATVVMRDTSWPGFGVPVCLARAEHLGNAWDEACTFSRKSALAPGAAYFEAEQRAVAASERALAIDMNTHTCPQARCAAIFEGIVHYSDNNHLPATYSTHLANRLHDAIMAAPWRWLN